MSKIFDALLREKGKIRDLSADTLMGDQIQASVKVAQAMTDPVITPPLHAPALSSPISNPRIVSLRLPERSPALPFNDEQWMANEQYRIVRTRLLQHVRQPKMILVSSAGSADGKSITAINLAGALALKAEANVLLVDADFRRSSIAMRLGIPESPGIAEMLEGKCNLSEAIVGLQEFGNLYILAAGRATANPAELLDSERWKQTVGELRRTFKYIVVDSPPIAALADYDLLQSLCDGVVIVVRPDHTNRAACRTALKSVPKDKLLGVLMNCVSGWFLGQQYGYGYGYGNDPKSFEGQKG
jgi:capsular exopolysaccharide synthesis family protein